MSQRVKAAVAQSRRRGSRYPKPSKRNAAQWQGCQRWPGLGDSGTEVSQTAVSVLTNRIGSPKRLHTEAIRSDEVTHAAEVQLLARGRYRNSRCSSDRHKDIHLTEGGLLIVCMSGEVSRRHSTQGKWAVTERIKAEVSQNWGRAGSPRLNAWWSENLIRSLCVALS